MRAPAIIFEENAPTMPATAAETPARGEVLYLKAIPTPMPAPVSDLATAAHAAIYAPIGWFMKPAI